MNAPTRPGFGKRQQGPQNPGVSANIKDASPPEIRLPPFPILPRHVQAAIHGAAYPIYEEFRHTWGKAKERRNIDSKSYVLEALKMPGLSIHDSGSEVPTHTTLTANPPATEPPTTEDGPVTDLLTTEPAARPPSATGDGPATDDPTTHSPEKDDGPDYKRLEKRIGTVLLKLEKYQGQHISKKRLQKFDITLTNMDFYTGQVDGTHTTQYLVPYPWEDVKREVEICKPPYLDYDEIPVNGRIEDLDSA